MKEIFIKAKQPGGNISLLERQFYEVFKKYLSTSDKKCLSGPFEGFPMEISQTEDPLFANYILRISLEER
jgi:hypothetical protein